MSAATQRVVCFYSHICTNVYTSEVEQESTERVSGLKIKDSSDIRAVRLIIEAGLWKPLLCSSTATQTRLSINRDEAQAPALSVSTMLLLLSDLFIAIIHS